VVREEQQSLKTGNLLEIAWKDRGLGSEMALLIPDL
jgi:hypothetical protein